VGLARLRERPGVPGGGLVALEAVFEALTETHFGGYILLES